MRSKRGGGGGGEKEGGGGGGGGRGGGRETLLGKLIFCKSFTRPVWWQNIRVGR